MSVQDSSALLDGEHKVFDPEAFLVANDFDGFIAQNQPPLPVPVRVPSPGRSPSRSPRAASPSNYGGLPRSGTSSPRGRSLIPPLARRSRSPTNQSPRSLSSPHGHPGSGMEGRGRSPPSSRKSPKRHTPPPPSASDSPPSAPGSAQDPTPAAEPPSKPHPMFARDSEESSNSAAAPPSPSAGIPWAAVDTNIAPLSGGSNSAIPAPPKRPPSNPTLKDLPTGSASAKHALHASAAAAAAAGGGSSETAASVSSVPAAAMSDSSQQDVDVSIPLGGIPAKKHQVQQQQALSFAGSSSPPTRSGSISKETPHTSPPSPPAKDLSAETKTSHEKPRTSLSPPARKNSQAGSNDGSVQDYPSATLRLPSTGRHSARTVVDSAGDPETQDSGRYSNTESPLDSIALELAMNDHDATLSSEHSSAAGDSPHRDIAADSGSAVGAAVAAGAVGSAAAATAAAAKPPPRPRPPAAAAAAAAAVQGADAASAAARATAPAAEAAASEAPTSTAGAEPLTPPVTSGTGAKDAPVNDTHPAPPTEQSSASTTEPDSSVVQVFAGAGAAARRAAAALKEQATNKTTTSANPATQGASTATPPNPTRSPGNSSGSIRGATGRVTSFAGKSMRAEGINRRPRKPMASPLATGANPTGVSSDGGNSGSSLGGTSGGLSGMVQATSGSFQKLPLDGSSPGAMQRPPASRTSAPAFPSPRRAGGSGGGSAGLSGSAGGGGGSSGGGAAAPATTPCPTAATKSAPHPLNPEAHSENSVVSANPMVEGDSEREHTSKLISAKSPESSAQLPQVPNPAAGALVQLSDGYIDDATADISSSEDLDNISTPADTPVTIRSQRENLNSPHFSHSPAAYYSQSHSSAMHKKCSDSFQKLLEENAAKASPAPEKLGKVLERLPEMAAAAKAAAAVPHQNQQPEASMKPHAQGKAAPAEHMGNDLEQVRGVNADVNSSVNSGVNKDPAGEARRLDSIARSVLRDRQNVRW